MPRFEQGVELGRLIERQRRTEDSVIALTKDVKEVRAEVTDIRVTLQRWALVASLWGAGLMLVAGNDKLADVAVRLIRDVAGKG